ncbi:MAG TPA: gamma-glutamyl-phosphate reductase, partial [Acidimicrobiaceae bacterium]|nr:gamma-glutamyl-phosphate reductase [Acidimicrobiaceae bacterium]
MRPNDRIEESSSIQELGERAKKASQTLTTASTEDKNETLRTSADCLVAATQEILDANLKDVRRA